MPKAFPLSSCTHLEHICPNVAGTVVRHRRTDVVESKRTTIREEAGGAEFQCPFLPMPLSHCSISAIIPRRTSLSCLVGAAVSGAFVSACVGAVVGAAPGACVSAGAGACVSGGAAVSAGACVSAGFVSAGFAVPLVVLFSVPGRL